MGDKSGIQWTDATWNMLRARDLESGAEGWACVRVSPGCKNCYASTLNEDQRWGRGTGREYVVGALDKVEHYLHVETLTQPLRWKKPRRVFVCSMTDLFGEWVTDEQLDRVFAVMALTPQHTYQVLTKRPERMRAYVSKLVAGGRACSFAPEVTAGIDTDRAKYVRAALVADRTCAGPLPNVWLGVSVEDQERAIERVPLLLDTPAAVRFLSCEPLLGPLELTSICHLLDWVIVGGESGPGARPFDLAWARSLRDQCAAAGTAFFLKQLGARPQFAKHAPGACDASEHFKACDGQHVLRLRHSHGSQPGEWPIDLQDCRAFPRTAVPA